MIDTERIGSREEEEEEEEEEEKEEEEEEEEERKITWDDSVQRPFTLPHPFDLIPKMTLTKLTSLNLTSHNTH